MGTTGSSRATSRDTALGRGEVMRVGLRYVYFVDGAGTSEELHPVRKDVSSYWDTSFDWRPYCPECETEIENLLQGVAHGEQFIVGDYRVLEEGIGDLV